jgi:transposase-like protein
MNNPHQNARMTRLGRAEMIRRVLEDGQPGREVARGFGISERTARKWLARYRAEGPSGLDNRSSCPRTVASRTAPYWTGVIAIRRREYRLTAAEVAGKLNLARSTVVASLTRRGLGRLTGLEPKEPPRRYRRQHPGELIHLDIKSWRALSGWAIASRGIGAPQYWGGLQLLPCGYR